MPIPSRVIHLLVLSVLAITPRVSAQNAFVVHEDDLLRPVREIRNGCPLFVVNGKLQMSSSPHFALIKAPFYLPGLITLPQFFVINRHLNLGTRTSSASLNYQIEVQGVAKSDVPLKRCFFVLEITAGKDTGVLFAHLPDLEAGKEEAFDQYFRLQTPLEEGHYLMHFFSDGVELLHSRMPAAYLAEQKQKSDDFRAAGRRNLTPCPPI
jgi:hypothetical protein